MLRKILVICMVVSLAFAFPRAYENRSREYLKAMRNQYLLEQQMSAILEDAMADIKSLHQTSKQAKPNYNVLDCLIHHRNC